MNKSISIAVLLIAVSACDPSPTALPTIPPSVFTPTVAPPTAQATPTLDRLQQAEVFSGHYMAAFEVSSFIPCAMNDVPGYGKGWWLEAVPRSDFYTLYEKTISGRPTPATPDMFPGDIVFVTFKGELSPLGSHGHLGQYPRMITVTQVLEMSLPENVQCDR